MGLIGETESRVYDVVNVNVAYPDGKGGTEHIQIPNGYAILAHQAIEYNKVGQSGYSFSLDGDATFGVSKQSVNEVFRELLDFAAQSGKEDKYKMRIEYLKKHALEVYGRSVNSHSRLNVTWYCNHDGNEFNKKGGSLHLAVKIEMVRAFAPVDLAALLEAFKEAIANDKPPDDMKLSMISV